MADYNTYYNNGVPGVNPYYNGGQQFGGYNNPGFVYNANAVRPSMVNPLSPEEMKVLSKSAPSKLDINITEEENLASRCNHHGVDGSDKVVQLNDGSGDVYCQVCKERFTPRSDSKEEVEELVKKLIDCMQTCKWVGDLNHPLINDYFPMIPLLKKFPDIYEYAMRNLNKFVASGNYQSANDAAVYAQYDQLMGGAPNPYLQGMGYNYNQPMYGQPQGQPMYGQPMYGQPMGYQQPSYAGPGPVDPNVYGQQNTTAYMNMPYGPGSSVGAAATNVNPMQSQPQVQQPYTPNYAPAGAAQCCNHEHVQNGAEVKKDDATATKETVVKLK